MKVVVHLNSAGWHMEDGDRFEIVTIEGEGLVVLIDDNNYSVVSDYNEDEETFKTHLIATGSNVRYIQYIREESN